MRTNRRRMMVEAGRVGLTGFLCGMMAVPQTMFAAPADTGRAHAKAMAAEPMQPLSGQEKVLHALNRFTFGPRPGDEAKVAQMGLNAWFEQQLHPETIDDSAFEERMKSFPAMQLSGTQLMRRFPSPNVLKRIALDKGGDDVGVPYDATERAIYRDGVAAYIARLGPDAAKAKSTSKGKKAAAKPQASTEQPSMQDGDATMKATQTAAAQTPPSDELNKKGKLKRKDEAARMDYGEVQSVLDMTPDERVARLVAMKPDQFLSFRAALRTSDRPRLMEGLSPDQMEVVAALTSGPLRVVASEALESRLERDVYSERQLQAVMTDFWLNHFSVYAKKNQNEPYYLPEYERKVILPNALGHFENLLVATAESPAMLMYLDNWESIGPNSPAARRTQFAQSRFPNAKIPKNQAKGINENYGRELMELHTLGVNGGYTQQDVIEVSKCFTGWTIQRPYQGGGGAIFDESRHEPGTKMVLGHKITENGVKEGMEVLHILATSPATAHFVSQKIAVRFVSDDPPPALVNRMATTFLKTNGDIKAVLLTMFHSPEFWSPKVYRAKVKTPIEFMASALRASGANVKNPLPLVQAMDRLGMPIYGMQTPNGYSWKEDAWVSSNALISRMNFALVLSSNRVPGTKTDWPALLNDADSTTIQSQPDATTEHRLEGALLGQPATERTRQTVMAQFTNPTAQQSAEESFQARKTSDEDESNGDMFGPRLLRARARRDRGPQARAPETPLDTMAGLLLGSPEFQKR